jgi:hypothetical protein
MASSSGKGPLDSFYKDSLRVGTLKVRSHRAARCLRQPRARMRC